eukprot:gnl/TRDRNA2_/TRDRNA2_39360_c0_seq1.p1 gnl/TRDRNA2_/TRDRNA2_39360_c0~~gnl/TRDRNA2_/TRDRNA2_39360_c0_seq1.p1  ORF type:complete len:403 (-),score=74.08 gnl/TRDRNA2_/TRDRNA2_39360_c0_seq1:140-1348(-)
MGGGGTQNGAAKSGPRSSDFFAFRRSYLTAYLCGTAADWLKGPYIYRFYEARGFSPDEITILFVAGYASSACFGLMAGMMGDAFGRRRMCLVFCALYAAHALMHLFHSFAVLLAARVLSGVATALLFSAFEAWMVCEHGKMFPDDDLEAIFAVQTQGNALVAVTSGLVAQGAVAVGGYVAPFAAAIPALCTCAFQVVRWPENVGNQQREVRAMVQTALSTMNSVVLRVGAMQSLFEGSMHIFVFLWTPCLARGGTEVPHGFVFAVYMLCMMAGGRYSRSKWFRLPLGVVFAIAGLCLFVPAAVDNLWFNLTAFCGFEWCVGCYYPQMAMLRSKHLDNKTRNATMTLFRVPLNFIVVFVLIWGRSVEPRRMLVFTTVCLFINTALYYSISLEARNISSNKKSD